MSSKVVVDVEGTQVALTNLEKVLYPAVGFTKAEVVDYYTRIAPVLLPHLRGRHLTLKRYPDGVDGQFFYEKQCPRHRPDWVRTARVPIRTDGRSIDYCMVEDLATVVWLANLADLELHTPLAHADAPAAPTMLAFDLDPGPPATVVECGRVAMWLREVFEGLGLRSCPKTSGSKGLQIYVPLNTPVTYNEAKPFAHALAKLLEQQHPKHVLSVMTKDLRTGKVFIDWSQNDDSKTTVCVYSLRARPHPTVSTPVTWDEVAHVVETGDPEDLVFEADAVLERVAAQGDLFAPLNEIEQPLPAPPTTS